MAQHDSLLLYLHQSFVRFTEVLTTEANCWEACKTKLGELQKEWQDKGLYGQNALNSIIQYQHLINWQGMDTTQFSRFYRFVFHLCRDPGKRNVPMELAVCAWRAVLAGRFRLLERWCAFAGGSGMRVVSEDTWRQVLDFARTIHEDLSNYDTAGAWAVLLDEFVEALRQGHGGAGAAAGSGGLAHTHRRRSSMAATGEDGSSGGTGSGGSMSLGLSGSGSIGSRLAAMLGAAAMVTGEGEGAGGDMADCMQPQYGACLSPHCGSKRREPDVDVAVVAQQLSAMPLGGHAHGQGQGQGYGGQHQQQQHAVHAVVGDPNAKRVCLEQARQQQQQQQHVFAGGVAAAAGGLGDGNLHRCSSGGGEGLGPPAVHNPAAATGGLPGQGMGHPLPLSLAQAAGGQGCCGGQAVSMSMCVSSPMGSGSVDSTDREGSMGLPYGGRGGTVGGCMGGACHAGDAGLGLGQGHSLFGGPGGGVVAADCAGGQQAGAADGLAAPPDCGVPGDAGVPLQVPPMFHQYHQHQQQQLQQQQLAHSRRAVKARRSGVSDMLRHAVTDALGI